jgi:hypothetical protein
MLAPAGMPPEFSGPLDESASGAAVAAAPDPRPRESIQPLASEIIDSQNAAALARHQREAGIEKRALAAVRRELARPTTTGAKR